MSGEENEADPEGQSIQIEEILDKVVSHIIAIIMNIVLSNKSYLNRMLVE